MKCTQSSELQVIMTSNFNLLLDCGFVKPTTLVKLEDKVEIIQAIALNYAILRSKAELDQFCEGLQSCGVLDAIRKYPQLTRDFFTINGRPQLTSGILLVKCATAFTHSSCYV